MATGNSAMRVEPGFAHRLGAVCDEDGTNFALFSQHAERVELCLYDPSGRHETARVDLDQTHDIWHGYLPGVGAGTPYGYRVHGPYQVHAGHRFNPHKLLLDPYARELTGDFEWNEAHYGYYRGARAQDLSFDQRDNAEFVPKSVVKPDGRPLNALRRPRVAWPETTIYELHVRGFTMRHPEVPEVQRGTFAGLAHPAVIDYLRDLGVTSIELLPIHAFIDEPFLVERNLTNYWGYNTLGYFLLHRAYLGGADPESFREFVARYHDAGLEVILDVVYNHTAEGNHLGPTLGFRGIDNSAYYQLSARDPRYYVNDSGCGNTLNLRHPRVLQLVLDSLRYWAGEFDVDGFRFDLATVLGRDERGFGTGSAFFQAIAQDPLLATRKMIAEPWDLGPGGYQLGGFPAGFAEWNDRYRDTVRRFWRGESGQLPELARRLHGSGDLFEHHGRKPWASINYFACHDGFTLRDLVSYERRDNGANREDNNDGHRENLSCNHGIEGPSDDPEIDALRWRQQRNFIATLLVSQGVPMLQAGDEFGRSQRGNNNAYCQDNELGWIDWDALDGEGGALLEFTRRLIELRADSPVLRADRFRHQAGDLDDDSIYWVNNDGKPMLDPHWHERDNRTLGYLLSTTDDNGDSQASKLLVLFNASLQAETFCLPRDEAEAWLVLIDTADPARGEKTIAAGARLKMAGRSLQILRAAPSRPDDHV